MLTLTSTYGYGEWTDWHDGRKAIMICLKLLHYLGYFYIYKLVSTNKDMFFRDWNQMQSLSSF